jgi:hypothetical protein
MDKMTVQEELISPFDATGEIIVDETIGDRHKMEISYSDALSLDEFVFSRINDFLGAISDGNPQIEITSKENEVVFILTADEKVYREMD